MDFVKVASHATYLLSLSLIVSLYRPNHVYRRPSYMSFSKRRGWSRLVHTPPASYNPPSAKSSFKAIGKNVLHFYMYCMITDYRPEFVVRARDNSQRTNVEQLVDGSFVSAGRIDDAAKSLFTHFFPGEFENTSLLQEFESRLGGRKIRIASFAYDGRCKRYCCTLPLQGCTTQAMMRSE